jgi:hypothetical protein
MAALAPVTVSILARIRHHRQHPEYGPEPEPAENLCDPAVFMEDASGAILSANAILLAQNRARKRPP